jgi:hypothetical protein
LKGFNWQRREEVLPAGEGGALRHMRKTDSGRSLFNDETAGIEIFIDDLSLLNNEFCTEFYVQINQNHANALMSPSTIGGKKSSESPPISVNINNK